MKQGRHLIRFFLGLSVVSWLGIVESPSAVAEIEFNPNKLVQLENLQQEILDESKTSSTEEGITTRQKGPTQAPSKPGVIRVQDSQVATSPDVYREQLKIISKEGKTLLERINIDLHADLNYDSNVFSEKKGRSDYFYSAGPDIGLDMTDLYKGIGFKLDYSGSWIQYASFSRLNRLEHELSVRIPGKGRTLRIGKKLTVDIRVGVSSSGGDDTSSADDGIFTQEFTPSVGLHVSYLISKKFSTDFDYNWEMRKMTGKAEGAMGTVSTVS